ncbi:MAG: hypothetical protein U9R75_00555 [Candidatus Thermoplasmatota archaeon]|nr:hypothetical protein [Candidatus Thermoplasmatota archaeon]
MTGSSSKIICPDCGITVHGKNLRKHYRKAHPGLDPYSRVKETSEHHIRKPHIEFTGSRIVGIVAVVLVIAALIIAGMVVYAVYFETDDAKGTDRDVFFAASDGVVINATFYSTTVAGAPTIYLVHDIGSDRSVWGEYAEKLRSEGYNALALDMRGHGGSVNSISTGEKLFWQDMDHSDLLGFSNDITAAYQWVQGDNVDGERNTDAGSDGSLIGIGKGGLYALNEVATMSRERVVSASVISPTLDCYSLDVEQIFEDFGDFRPILLAASEGDGTGGLAINTIMERKAGDDETNGHGVYVPGSDKGITLLSNNDLWNYILDIMKVGWVLNPQ